VFYITVTCTDGNTSTLLNSHEFAYFCQIELSEKRMYVIASALLTNWCADVY